MGHCQNLKTVIQKSSGQFSMTNQHPPKSLQRRSWNRYRMIWIRSIGNCGSTLPRSLSKHWIIWESKVNSKSTMRSSKSGIKRVWRSTRKRPVENYQPTSPWTEVMPGVTLKMWRISISIEWPRSKTGIGTWVEIRQKVTMPTRPFSKVRWKGSRSCRNRGPKESGGGRKFRRLQKDFSRIMGPKVNSNSQHCHLPNQVGPNFRKPSRHILKLFR